jgi:hypothetical protein
MEKFLKWLGWIVAVFVVLGLAEWLQNKNDIQTFWIFVVLWAMQYIHNARHQELMNRLSSMQAKLDSLP